MKKLQILILITAICSAFILRQGEAQVGGEVSKSTFTCLLLDELPMEELFYRDGESYLPIEFRRGKRSKDYPLGNGNEIELFSFEVNAEGESYYKRVGAASPVAGSSSSLLIILFAEAETDLPLNVMVLDDSMEGFPPGFFRFVNLTDTELLVDIVGEVTELGSGSVSLVESHFLENDGMAPVSFTRLEEHLYFTRLYTHARSREMVFIRKSKNPKQALELTFVPQNVPVKASARSYEAVSDVENGPL